MAEPRKVQFVTLSSFNTSPPTQESSKKRRREDEAVTHGKDGGGGAAAVGSGGGGGGLFGNAKGGDAAAEDGKPTVRLCLSLSEPNERGSSEFNYGELVQPSPQVRHHTSGSRPSVIPSEARASASPALVVLSFNYFMFYWIVLVTWFPIRLILSLLLMEWSKSKSNF